MFDFNFFEKLYIIHFSYAFFMFLFYHRSLVEQTAKATKKSLEEVNSNMTTTYVMMLIFGSLCLLFDLIQLIFNHRKCIWLHPLYRNQKDE